MRSNYKKIGKYIRKVNTRNVDLVATTLLGINIDKFFMPSVANIVGTDMSTYKIVKKRQFSCNRMHVGRDYRLPISISTSDEDFLVSPAYDVFEVKNEEEILPEYLMMWFLRSEFDRNSWFYTDADVRGGLHWDAFCDMELPIPSLEKQREIVKEYYVVKNRIELNSKLIQKLEETAQAIYKQWFVDFEFPDENGNPYKSSGGEMVWCEELEMDIPNGWEIDSLSGIANYLNGLAMQKYSANSSDFIPVIKIRELSNGLPDASSDKARINIPKEYIIDNGDVIFSWSGTLKVEIWTGGKGGLNQHLFKVTSMNYEKWFYYLWTRFHLEEFIRVAAGKAVSMGHIKRENLDQAKVLIPLSPQLNKMDQVMKPIFEMIINHKIEKRSLLEIKDLLLSKLATVNN